MKRFFSCRAALEIKENDHSVISRAEQLWLVISYVPLHFPNKEIMSGFPAEFTKHYFVAAYLYVNKSTKDGPVALIKTYVLMYSVSLCSLRS